jgi:riboflavin synthase
MFTGIVRELGRVEAVEGGAERVRLRVAAPETAASATAGDSVSVGGVCLTATHVADGVIAFDAVPETLRRTALRRLDPGAPVNIEPALRAGDPLGGHIVQGHVDGVGSLLRRDPGTRSDELTFGLPAHLGRYVVEKGSITVDGVSLTVAATDGATFSVALIPTTLTHTTLGSRAVGDTVNLEVDVVAKYVERLVAGYGPSGHGVGAQQQVVDDE